MSLPRPPRVLVTERINKTRTRGSARAMLLAATHWLDLTTWRLWPSVENWSEMAGVSARTGRRALRRLEAVGWVVPVEPSAGGITDAGIGLTTIYELRLPPLASNPVAVTGLDPGTERRLPGQPDSEPGQSVQRTRTRKPGNPVTVSANLSIQPSKEQTRDPSTRETISNASGDGWMGDATEATVQAKPEASDAGTLLKSLGVRGPNLPKLIAAGVTVEQIKAHVATIQQSGDARNMSALLAWRLAQDAELCFSSRPKLDPASKRLVGSIEQLRRHTPNQPDAVRVGDAFAPEPTRLITPRPRREAEIKREIP